MNSPLRIGVLGLTHDHVWSNLDELSRCERATLVAAADPHEPLREKVVRQHPCATYEQSEELLDRESLDAVYIYSDNRSGVELVELAAAHGLHILIEKPLAHNLEGAERAVAAARRADVRLMVNWPFAWWPQLRHALTLAESGAIGTIWQIRYRAAHAGPEVFGCSEYFCDWLFDAERNGGGALIDYCCYGSLLARRLLGQPERVTAVAGRLVKQKLAVEDNAVLLMSYSQAIALAEASWSQVGKLSSYTTLIYGTRGTLQVEPRQGGRLLCATAEQPDGAAMAVPALPAESQNASQHFAHCVRSGDSFQRLCSADLARDVQEILEAGLRAARTGRTSSIPLQPLV